MPALLWQTVFMDIQEEIAARLRKARIAKGYPSATAAAEAFGWNLSTYTQHENGKRGFKFQTAMRYAQAFGCGAVWLMTGREAGAGERLSLGPLHPVDFNESVPVVGVAQAGTWIDAHDVMQEPLGHISTVRDERFPGLEHISYRVQGDSFDQFVRDGGHVICVRWAETGLELKAGMTVVAEQSRDGGLIQRTIKTVEGGPGNWRLAPRSSNPRHKPLVFKEGDHVEVVALVVQFISPAAW